MFFSLLTLLLRKSSLAFGLLTLLLRKSSLSPDIRDGAFGVSALCFGSRVDAACVELSFAHRESTLPLGQFPHTLHLLLSGSDGVTSVA